MASPEDTNAIPLSAAEKEMLGSLTEEELEAMLREEMEAKQKKIDAEKELLGLVEPSGADHGGSNASGGIPGWLAMALCLFGGLGIGSFVFLMKYDPKATASTSEHDTEAHGKEHEPARMEDVAELIEHDKFADALTKLEQLQKANHDLKTPTQQYLGALCLEGQKKWDKAFKEYVHIGEKEKLTSLAIASKLGEIRCQLQLQQFDEASTQLGKMILVSGLEVFHEHPFEEDFPYLRTLGIMMKLSPTQAPSPLNPTLICSSTRSWHVGRFMQWVPIEESGDAPAKDSHHHTGIKGVQKLSIAGSQKKLENRLISAELPEISIGKLLEMFSKETSTALEISAEFAIELNTIPVTLHLHGQRIDDFLNALALVRPFHWSISGGKLVMVRSESPTELEIQTAIDRVREGTIDHEWISLIDVEEASWLARLNRDKEAIQKLLVFVNQFPEDHEAIVAQFNLGLLYHRGGNRTLAQQAFLEATDRDASDWSVAGLWWVGRLHLDNWEPNEATFRFRQAFKNGRKGEWAGITILGLAAADFIRNDLKATHDWLMINRRMLRKDGIREEAALLDALACFENGGQDERHPKMHQEELSYAALSLKGPSLLGSTGIYFRGMAFKRLELTDSLVQLFEEAIPKIRGPIGGKMALALAESHRDLGHEEASRKWFEAVQASQSEGTTADRARFELAKIALKRHESKQVIILCQGLVRGGHIEKSELLRLLGTAHEQLGDFELASRYFAGEENLE
jgi:tetratricopeptide (TPR) repeat protein